VCEGGESSLLFNRFTFGGGVGSFERKQRQPNQKMKTNKTNKQTKKENSQGLIIELLVI
jgi:hypothetical protein